MAKDDEKKPTAAEKGKGKAVNGDAEKKEDTKADGKDKKVETAGGTSCPQDRRGGVMPWTCTDGEHRGTQRGRPAAEERTGHAGRADTGMSPPPTCRVSPRFALTIVQESDTSLYKPALDQIKEFIKTSTSSMTAVPKPLKFLRPHYESLEKQYASWPEGENKVRDCV
jgi:26S proteasome regulatory subunit N1